MLRILLAITAACCGLSCSAAPLPDEPAAAAPGGAVAPAAPAESPTEPAPVAETDAVITDLEALLDEARQAHESGDNAEARRRIAAAIERALAELGPRDDAPALGVLEAMGRLAQETGESRAAQSARERVLDGRSRTLPDEHPDVQLARFNLGVTLSALGDLSGARALFQQVVDVRSRTLPDDHMELQKARVNLAVTLSALGDLDGARALDEQVLDVQSRTLPDDHPDLQRVRQNLGIVLDAQGDLDDAQALFEKVLEVRLRTMPAEHPQIQAARVNLGVTLAKLGDLPRARVLQEQAVEIMTRTLPDDYADLQNARLSLADTIRELGDLPGARLLEEHVLEVRSRTLPDEHPAVQKARLGLGITLMRQGDLGGAVPLFERVLEVRSRTLPDDHPELQRARLSLGVARERQGDLDGARALQEQVLEVYTRTRPDHDPNLQLARMDLALTLERQGELAAARSLGEQALAVGTQTLPDVHPNLMRARLNLARVVLTQAVRAREDRQEAGPTIEEARATCSALYSELCFAQARAAHLTVLCSNSREAEELCARMSNALFCVLTFARGAGVLEPSRDLEPACFMFSESTRAAGLAAAASMRQASQSPEYARLRDSVRQASEALATLAQQGTSRDAFRQALANRESAERRLVELAGGLQGADAAPVGVEADAIAARLAANEAVVAYRVYDRHDFPVSPGAAGAGTPFDGTCVFSLCAFVVRPPDLPPAMAAPGRAKLTLIDLGPLEPIEAAVRAWRESIGADVQRGARVATSAGDGVFARGAEVRRLIFDPLLESLAGADHLIVTLDGVLHTVPIEVLPAADHSDPGDAGATIGESWRIETRCSLAELLAPDAPRASPDVLVALGGASFDSAPSDEAEAEVAVAEPAASATVASAMLRGGAWEHGFDPLANTGLEAREIAALHDEVFGKAATSLVLEEREASRAGVQDLAPRARWLHLATHGWFAVESIRSWDDLESTHPEAGPIPPQGDEARIMLMSPMLACGLALAGANLLADEVGRSPGLVTAEEIAAWDLSNCELAVLSACDTNVGIRRAGQGVASLQKALHMAGARSVITSLWKVPDEATKELMLDFYRRLWVEQKPKGQALWESKLRLRDARDEHGAPLYTTRDWAGWVLTGAPD